MIVAAWIGGLTALALFYKLIFRDKEDLFDCIKFWLTPDIISMFRGSYWDDNWAELKLIVWLGLSVGIGYGIYHL